MEARLDADFSDVRLHTGPAAQRSAAEIGARAYTSGSHVVLGAGGTDRHTLAHELTHVIQQRQGPVAGTDDGTGLRVSDPSDRFERAAEANAVRAMAGPVPEGGAARRRSAVQRSKGDSIAVQMVTSTKGPSLGAAAEKAGDLTAAGDANNQFTAASVAGGYRDPAATTSAAQYGTIVGAGAGTLTSFVGLVGNVIKFGRARTDRRKSSPGTAAYRRHDRELKAGAAGTAEQGLSVGNMSTGLASSAMNLSGAAQEAVGGVAAASAGAGLLVGSVQSVRYIRKADKARQRVNKLRQLMADEKKPEEALEAANKEVGTLEWTVSGDEYDLREVERSLQSAIRGLGQEQIQEKKEVWHSRIKDILRQKSEIEEQLQRDQAELAVAELRQQERAEVSRKMHEALVKQTEKVERYTESASVDISLREIQEYAAGKNIRGVTVKAIGAVAALLGVGGSVAALVAAVALAAGVAAGAGVLVATPVGWGLAGAAATVALGVAGWKTWRFFQHRWKQSAKPDHDGTMPTIKERLRRTLAFWKASGPNEREQFAAALYDMAHDVAKAERSEEARNTIDALGLNWGEMKDDREAGKVLISEKFKSVA
ncbi:DUF4157 domain-containing protein [Streptomyces sp. NBC_01478]|uniref:eCIS core domain-containing protein n=1 Tax=Streptomyces sp. NBC_01478 TaxID=2903882 RepID=UPI002E348760|nr:DUF4157 domain-containing protein [Streptomyces sp. NBC_01478]